MKKDIFVITFLLTLCCSLYLLNNWYAPYREISDLKESDISFLFTSASVEYYFQGKFIDERTVIVINIPLQQSSNFIENCHSYGFQQLNTLEESNLPNLANVTKNNFDHFNYNQPFCWLSGDYQTSDFQHVFIQKEKYMRVIYGNVK